MQEIKFRSVTKQSGIEIIRKVSICILLSLCTICTCLGGNKSKKSPNIILIMCDDLGWGDTGFNGSTKVITPHLDALANKGMVLNRFYSASAVCSPTRGSCLTGRNPYRLGIPNANTGKLKTEEITISELLKDKGYATGHFGKWHLGTLTTKIRDANRGKPGKDQDYSIPSMHGYDEYFVTESKVPTYDPMLKPKKYLSDAGESRKYGWQAIKRNELSESFGTHYWKGEEISETTNLDGEDTRVTMDRVIPFVEKSVKEDTPFFSVIWIHTPHLPVVAKEEMMAMYKQFTHKEQLYYASITAMDLQIGRLWEKLNDLEISDNTMLWFCSDNGPEVGTPGSAGKFRGRKRDLFEGGVRVPAFCVWPNGIKAGQKSDFPMVTSDYLPTIIDVLDINYPDNRPLDGISVNKVLKGNSAKRKKAIGFHYLHRLSWVTDEYKLISTDNGESYQLYNLLKDPSEETNIIDKNQSLAKSMQKELNNWVKSCSDSEAGKDF